MKKKKQNTCDNKIETYNSRYLHKKGFMRPMRHRQLSK